MGGNYSFHECIPIDQADQIYEEFEYESYSVHNGESKYGKVTNFQFVRNSENNMKYLIHVFKLTKKDKNQRPTLAVNAGVYYTFPQYSLGYIRVFSMICKLNCFLFFILNFDLLDKMIVTLINISNFKVAGG